MSPVLRVPDRDDVGDDVAGERESTGRGFGFAAPTESRKRGQPPFLDHRSGIGGRGGRNGGCPRFPCADEAASRGFSTRLPTRAGSSDRSSCSTPRERRLPGRCRSCSTPGFWRRSGEEVVTGGLARGAAAGGGRGAAAGAGAGGGGGRRSTAGFGRFGVEPAARGDRVGEDGGLPAGDRPKLREREPGACVLVLVPEIALTPQTVGRFAARFGAEDSSGSGACRRRGAALGADAGAAARALAAGERGEEPDRRRRPLRGVCPAAAAGPGRRRRGTRHGLQTGPAAALPRAGRGGEAGAA